VQVLLQLLLQGYQLLLLLFAPNFPAAAAASAPPAEHLLR
jgi:hypothetical protein